MFAICSASCSWHGRSSSSSSDSFVFSFCAFLFRFSSISSKAFSMSASSSVLQFALMAGEAASMRIFAAFVEFRGTRMCCVEASSVKTSVFSRKMLPLLKHQQAMSYCLALARIIRQLLILEARSSWSRCKVYVWKRTFHVFGVQVSKTLSIHAYYL